MRISAILIRFGVIIDFRGNIDDDRFSLADALETVINTRGNLHEFMIPITEENSLISP